MQLLFLSQIYNGEKRNGGKIPMWKLRKMGARHRAPGGSDCSFEMELGALIKTMEEFINTAKNVHN